MMRSLPFATLAFVSTVAALPLLIGGCSSSDNGGSPPSTPTSDSCAGAFVRLDAKHMVDSADFGFEADAQGLVFDALPTVSEVNSGSGTPALIQTASLDGKLATVYTASHQSVGAVHMDATSIFFLDHGVSQLPRAGGTPTPIAPTTGTVYDFTLDDTNVYLSVLGADSNTIVSTAKSGGTQKTLVTRKGVKVTFIGVDAGNLYWREEPEASPGSAKELWKMSLTDLTPVDFATIPASLNAFGFGVGADTVAFTSFDLTASPPNLAGVYTMKQGGMPTKVDDKGGSPMIVNGGSIYYTAQAGVMRAPLAGGMTTLVAPLANVAMAGIAVTDSTVYYATESCIYKQAK